MSRIDKTEYAKRIFIIQGWIIDGVQSPLIIRQIITSGWTNAAKEKDQERSAARMLKVARDSWTTTQEGDIDQKRQLKIAQLEQYKRGMKDVYKGTPAGMRALLAIDKEIIMLDGLRKATKIEVTGKGGNPIETKNYNISLTKEEIQNINEQLEKDV